MLNNCLISPKTIILLPKYTYSVIKLSIPKHNRQNSVFNAFIEQPILVSFYAQDTLSIRCMMYQYSQSNEYNFMYV